MNPKRDAYNPIRNFLSWSDSYGRHPYSLKTRLTVGKPTSRHPLTLLGEKRNPCVTRNIFTLTVMFLRYSVLLWAPHTHGVLGACIIEFA